MSRLSDLSVPLDLATMEAKLAEDLPKGPGWRPDKSPTQCTLAQLRAEAAPAALAEALT